MKLKFWGVRGSIASPGEKTVRYGGNTTCIEIRSNNNELIILDGGTGIFPLAQALLKELPVTAHIFSTHSHWDHIQGLPFFTPIYVPGNIVKIYGAYDPVADSGPEHIMRVQLQYSYFPVREAEINSNLEYISLKLNETVKIGDATVTPVLLNHSVVDLGYRIDCNGKSIFFTGDHEPHFNIYDPADKNYDKYQSMIATQRQTIIDAILGVDVIVADASYTPDEYLTRRGWGHGTFDSCIQLALDAGAKTLYCTHHEPTRSDDALEAVFTEALARNAHAAKKINILLAREGEEILI
jgi:phosphoribosyl 1,2-cyclic phosphodiesterase